MSDAAHARRGILTTGLSQGSKFVIQFAATVLLARILVPDDFGTFAMVVAITGFATLIGDFGLSTAAIQARELSRQQRSNLFWLSLGIGVLLWGVVTLLAQPIESFYDHEGLADVVRVVAINFVVTAAASQFTASLTRELRFGWLAASDIASQAVALGVAVLVGLAGLGVWALVAQQIAIAVIALLISAVGGRWVPTLPRRAPMRNLLSFGAGSFGVQALTYLSSNVDSIVLGRVAGATQLGLYDQAYRLFKVPVQQIAAPLTRVALPLLSRRQNDAAGFGRMLIIAQSGMTYALGALFVVGAALAEPAVSALLGQRWLESAPLFSILAIGGLFQSMGYVYYWCFLALGLANLQLRWSLLTRSVMIAAIIVCAQFGATGVAIAVSASLAFNWLVLTAFPLQRTGLATRPLITAAARALLLHVLVGAVVLTSDLFVMRSWAGDWLRLCVGAAIAAAVYVLAFAVVRPLRRDIAPLIRLIRSKGRTL